MRKLLALTLSAFLVSVCFVGFVSVQAAAGDGEVSVSVSDEVAFSEDALAKLYDGVFADDATAFSDDRLVSFKWEDFDPEGTGSVTYTIVLDLGEVTGIRGVKIGAYKELNSFINLPAVKLYLSNDGSNFVASHPGTWGSEVEGLVADTTRESSLLGACTYTSDWTNRAVLEARYVKLVLVQKDEWVFLSEIDVDTTDDPGQAVDEVALAGIDEGAAAESVVVITCDAGEVSLEALEASEEHDLILSRVRLGNLTFAKWDEDKQAYVIYKNEINPWPNNRSGSLTVAEDEIVIAAISNGGNLPDAGAPAKWVMWKLEVGTELRVYEDVIAIGKELSDETQLTFGSVVLAEPSEPSEPEEPSEPGEPSEPEEPSEPGEPSEPSEPSEPTPPTGDIGFVGLGIIAAVATAGVIIARKSR